MSKIDLQGMGRAHQILLGGAVLLVIDMFFTWQGVSLLGTTVGVSGWHGFLGVVLGLVTVALVVWEVMLLLGEQTAELRSKVPGVEEKLISSALAAAVLVFGIIKFLSANELRRWPEWVGLVLALAIGFGGWLAFSERQTETEAPQPSALP